MKYKKDWSTIGGKMTEALKDMFNKEFFDRFTNDLMIIIKDFNTRKFVSQIISNSKFESPPKKRLIAPGKHRSAENEAVFPHEPSQKTGAQAFP